MPTTSNFGWTTPADTDLVKDGAAAIRTLGNGVDASLVDLKGGTTGQVLSKATNTDLDYTWITPNVGDITEVQAGTGISVASGTGPIPVVTNTVATAFDAAGDLVYGTGADTFTKLSLGVAGRVLKVNSGATAPEWAIDPVADVVTTAGDLIYGTAADTVTRLGLGTAGQVLTVNSGATAPIWATAAGGAANWSLLNAGGTALTGAATITVSGISGKDQILIVVSDASSANTTSEIRIRFNADSLNNYVVVGANYGVTTTYAVDNYTDVNLLTSSYIPLGRMANVATAQVSGGLMLSGGNAAGVKAYTALGAGRGVSSQQFQMAYLTQGVYTGSSTISSISVLSSTGNFDAGTVYVYASA